MFGSSVFFAPAVEMSAVVILLSSYYQINMKKYHELFSLLFHVCSVLFLCCLFDVVIDTIIELRRLLPCCIEAVGRVGGVGPNIACDRC